MKLKELMKASLENKRNSQEKIAGNVYNGQAPVPGNVKATRSRGGKRIDRGAARGK